MLIVLTTVADKDEAENLARRIIETRLAGCVQVLPEMKSFYSWKEEIRCDSEVLLLIKTEAAKYSKLEEFLIENHSYDVPEIVSLSASNVSAGYLKWLTGYLE